MCGESKKNTTHSVADSRVQDKCVYIYFFVLTRDRVEEIEKLWTTLKAQTAKKGR